MRSGVRIASVRPLLKLSSFELFYFFTVFVDCFFYFLNTLYCDTMIFLILLLFVLILTNQPLVNKIVIEVTNNWFYNLLPTLYPSMVLTSLIIDNKTINYFFNYIYTKFESIIFFNNSKTLFIFIISLICGAPASTKLIMDSYNNQNISINDSKSLLYITPTFSLPYVIYIFNLFDINSYIVIYFIITILVQLFFLKILTKRNNDTPNIYKKTNQSFFTIIDKSTNIILSILGIMIIFNLALKLFKIPNSLYILFEPLCGQIELLNLEINKKLRDILLFFSLSFQGLSIHIQIKYVSNLINIFKLILFRFLFAIIVVICFFLIIIFI